MTTQSESPLFILYGSATGNAEYIAKDLAAVYTNLLKNPDTDTYFPSVVCCELDQFKRTCQTIWDSEPATAGTKHGVLVVTSTTGNADPPEKASRFFRFIKRKGTVDTQPFRHCAFAVLALGDTNYDSFCYTGKQIDKKLSELGGTWFAKVASADEALGLEDVVEPWVGDILAQVTENCWPRGRTSSGTSGCISGAGKENTEKPAIPEVDVGEEKGREDGDRVIVS
jgi:sulfite reductase alpha subunit-like flavoprotein